MSFSAGSLVGKVKLDKSGWDTNTQAVKKDQKTMGAGFAKMGSAAKKFGKMTALAGIAVAGAFAVMVKKSIAFGDQIHKLSKKTGVSTEELSSLKLAAELGGASLEGVAKGIFRLSKGMSDMQRGIGLAKDAFKDLGLTVTKEDGTLKGTSEMMLEVADKFKGMEDGAKKAALAQEIFGKSGVELIPMLNEGKDGIQKLKDEAQKYGIVIDQEAANKSAKFTDNMTKLGSIVQGVGLNLTNELLPYLNKFSDWAIKNKDSITSLFRETFKALKTLMAPFKTIIKAAMLYAKIKGIDADATQRAAEANEFFGKKLDANEKALMDAGVSMGAYNTAMLDFKKYNDGTTQGLYRQQLALIRNAKKYPELTTALEGLRIKNKEAAKATDETTNKIKTQGKVIKKTSIDLFNQGKGFLTLKNTAIESYGSIDQITTEFYNKSKAKSLTWTKTAIANAQEVQNMESEIRLTKEEQATVDKEMEAQRLEDWKIQKLQALQDAGLSADEYREKSLAVEAVYQRKMQQLDNGTAKKKKMNLKNLAQASIQIGSNALALISQLTENAYNKRKKTLDNWYKNEKKKIEESTMSEAEKKAAMEALDTEYHTKAAAMEKSHAKKRKLTAIGQAIINTAQGITRALTLTPPMSWIMAAITGAMGAAQIAAIKAQPMEVGGQAKADGLAYLHKNEVVMPFNKVEEKIYNRSEGSGGSEQTTIEINPIIYALDGDSVRKVFQEDLIPMIQDAFKKEDLLVYPAAVRSY